MNHKGIFDETSSKTRPLKDETDQEEIYEVGGSTTIVSIVENRARDVCICKINTGSVRMFSIVWQRDLSD